MRNGIEKKIIIIVASIIGVILLIGIGKLIYDQVKPTNPNRLEATYIGENHIVGQELTIDEFQIQEVYNGQTYPVEAAQVTMTDNILGENGASVKLSFVNREGKTLTTTVNVACITAIDYVEVVQRDDTEYYINYDVSPDQFIMTAYNAEGYSAIVPPEFYTIENPRMSSEEYDFSFLFVNPYDNMEFNPILTVTNGIEMYVRELDAQYNGPEKYYGQSVEPEEFSVTAVLGNGEEIAAEDFPMDYLEIENPYLENAFNEVVVYYANPNGTQASSTVEVPASNYCTSISSAVFIGNPKSVGDVIQSDELEVMGKFYDGKIEKIQGFEIVDNQLMEETNTIELTYVNEVGDDLSIELEVDAEQNLLFIGDERIHDLEFDVSGNGDKVYFVSDENADYDWLVNEGIAEANSIMKQNSLTTFRVVFMVGIDDMDRVNDYIALYNKVATDTWANQRIYVASITPVDEEKIAEGGVYDANTYVNTDIKAFNDAIQEAFQNDKGVHYVNTYGEMLNGHLDTTDGLLLTTESNQYYYELVKALAR